MTPYLDDKSSVLRVRRYPTRGPDLQVGHEIRSFPNANAALASAGRDRWIAASADPPSSYVVDESNGKILLSGGGLKTMNVKPANSDVVPVFRMRFNGPHGRLLRNLQPQILAGQLRA